MEVIYKRRIFISHSFLCLIGLLTLAGCSYFRNERTVVVSFPELPESMKRRLRSPDFVLAFPSIVKNAYDIEHLYVTGEYAQAAKEDDRQVVIRLPKDPYVPCLAYPVTEAGRLKPAGGITDTDGLDCVRLSWEDGFTAEVLLRLFVETDTYGGINVQRLVHEVREAAVQANGLDADPWRFDKLPILLGFGYGSFSSHRISELETRCLDELPLAPGTWFWDNPLKEPLEVPDCGLIDLEDIPLGTHTLMYIDGPEYVSLHISRREWYAVYPLKEEYRSGSW